MSDAPPTASPTTLTVDASTLSLALLAERIQGERDQRVLASDYERQIRELTDAHERETRELVWRLETARIDYRLGELNNERARQQDDRGTFATRESVTALGDAMASASRELAASVTLLKEQRERDLGRASGSQGVQSWLAPNLGSIVALIVGAIAIVLFLQGQP